MTMRYVSGAIDSLTYNDWLAPLVWTIEDEQDPAAEALVYEIIGLKADHDLGIWTEPELRHQMMKAVEKFRAVTFRMDDPEDIERPDLDSRTASLHSDEHRSSAWTPTSTQALARGTVLV